MTPNHIRRLLKDYEVERIYLLAEDKSQTQHRKKIGGNKKQKYTEGWVEFSDKAIAKLAALTLNGQAMGRSTIIQRVIRGHFMLMTRGLLSTFPSSNGSTSPPNLPTSKE